MINVILGALLPVVVTLALGMLAGWRRDQDVGAARSLNHMVLTFALPLALFAGTITIPRPELISDWPLLVILLTATLLPFLAALLARQWKDRVWIVCAIPLSAVPPGDSFIRETRKLSAGDSSSTLPSLSKSDHGPTGPSVPNS